jgi:hypothetical protein
VSPYQDGPQGPSAASAFDASREQARAAELVAAVDLRSGRIDQARELLPEMRADAATERRVAALLDLVDGRGALPRDRAAAAVRDSGLGAAMAPDVANVVVRALSGDDGALAVPSLPRGLPAPVTFALGRRLGTALGRMREASRAETPWIGPTMDPTILVGRLYASLVSLEALSDEAEAAEVRAGLGRVRRALLAEDRSLFWQVYYYGERGSREGRDIPVDAADNP